MSFEWVNLYDAAFNDRPLKDQLKDWLYDSEWSKQKYDEYTLLNAFPIVSDYMDYLLDSRAADEYLVRYGMDYSDIHDPRKLPSSQSGSRLIRNSLQYISKNVHKLYS